VLVREEIAMKTGEMATQEMAQRLRLLVSPLLRGGFLLLGRFEVSLGRAPGCHVLLPSREVSRRHARLFWDETDGHFVVDLGSRNGTYVNGTRVSERHRLDAGDEIRIGPFRLSYTWVRGSREELAKKFDPRVGETNVLSPNWHAPLFAGAISGDILVEACLMIELNRHSGEMRIVGDREKGIMRFKNGMITGARYGKKAGATAARIILALRRGHYAFAEGGGGQAPSASGLAIRPSALALEIARERDETRACVEVGQATIEEGQQAIEETQSDQETSPTITEEQFAEWPN
jgi:pSer/pThr/pTyr-binding forkhead associated (FHA) protein